jgi:predicted nucleic acid-binding protein
MTTLYIDTDVIGDATLGRRNRFGKNIGNPASDLFFEAISCKYQLIISTWLLEELRAVCNIDQTKMFFELIKKKILAVSYSSDEKSQAEKRSKEHKGDALHIIIAEREHADYIITRNKDHFLAIGTCIPIKKPEELL